LKKPVARTATGFFFGMNFAFLQFTAIPPIEPP
jgi:hypothetical protein